MLMTDANENTWERRWFVLRRCVPAGIASWRFLLKQAFFPRPYLHMYAHSNEVEEIGVISLTGVNVESNPEMETLLGVRVPHFLSNTDTDWTMHSRKSSRLPSSPLRIRMRLLLLARRSSKHGLRSWIRPDYLHDASRTFTTRKLYLCTLSLSFYLHRRHSCPFLFYILRFTPLHLSHRSLCLAYL